MEFAGEIQFLETLGEAAQLAWLDREIQGAIEAEFWRQVEARTMRLDQFPTLPGDPRVKASAALDAHFAWDMD